ncbi:MAG: AmmeMemoRadiSam system radical SAM enzyme [Kofleriaceae bacterium]|nr:AmmeMemoRadiSam system radical SAM enzyme [Myxococcales bacterium]MCB9562703.1 AmmeMemoRadiSam system radical SAM enzyme [Kofleriaceae bacterium]MCB9571022.1 AmmeMemoRadiSam system radical SAM enzyme [Kofleriaceae bacterium]
MSFEGRAGDERAPKETTLDGLDPSELHPARFWSPAPEQGAGKIRCELCPRACVVGPNQRAFCFVRANHDGQMVLTTWGRSSGFCVDPIEKKPLNHFHPGSSVLSFGTAGCNLGCKFCQNWDISKARQFDKLADQATPEGIADAAVRLDARSIAFTYNDPVIFAEWALDVAAACRARGVATVAVTAGYITDAARPEFYAGMDAANVDLKAFTEAFYHKLCLAELAPVLDTLRWLRHETDVWFEVTTLLIPGHNDSPAEIDALVGWFADNLGPEVPLHFTAFHADYRMTDIPGTPAATLARARRQALAAGLEHVYTGNVHDPAGQSTYCAGCGALLIARDGYTLGAYRIKDGACPDCGKRVAGRFDTHAGTWGSRRLRVVM